MIMNNSLSIRLIVFTFLILWFQSLFGFSPWKPDIVIYGDSSECVIFKYLDGTNDTIFFESDYTYKCIDFRSPFECRYYTNSEYKRRELMGLDSAFMRRGWIREYIEKFVMKNLSGLEVLRKDGSVVINSQSTICNLFEKNVVKYILPCPANKKRIVIKLRYGNKYKKREKNLKSAINSDAA